MKFFSTYLVELFNRPWQHIETDEYTTRKSLKHHLAGVFDSKFRRENLLSVRYTYADPKNPKDPTKYLTVLFEQQNKNSWELLFYIGGNTSAKVKSDEGGIFVSVLDAADKFLKKHKPQFITITAASQYEGKEAINSRERAYAALVKRFASQYGYKVDYKYSGSTKAMWKLKRLEP